MFCGRLLFLVWSLHVVLCSESKYEGSTDQESVLCEDEPNQIDFPQGRTKGSTLYALDNRGIFHCSSPPDSEPSPETTNVVYTVLKNGVLIPTAGQYAVHYKMNRRGDLIPKSNNTCIYTSDKPAFYISTHDNKLIPVDIFYTKKEINYVFGGNKLVFSEKLEKHSFDNELALEQRNGVPMVPDKSCNGDVILFLLKSNGVFRRNPPDEYIPKGMKIRYHLQDDGLLTPLFSKTGLPLTYITDSNGDLNPCQSNTHTFTTLQETSKCFMLGEGGRLAPVSETMDVNKTINYFYDGQLVHSSKQFNEVFSNTSMLVLAEKDSANDTQLQRENAGPKFVCPRRRISKRDTEEVKYHSTESEEKPPCKVAPAPNPHCRFAYDDCGRRILLEPYINSYGHVSLYKLTCTGQLQRLNKYKEPEFGFEVKFRLIENFVLVPTSKENGKLTLRYTLQENGNLVPCLGQCFSLKKAPASMAYFVLGKNKELLPVRVNILKCNHIQLYFQDCLIYTIGPDVGKDLEVFTTIYAPFYAYVCGRIVVGYSDFSPRHVKGSTWSNPEKDCEQSNVPSKNLFLIGPKGQKIKIFPFINKNGVPVMYEMDCNGVAHRSPKEKNKNMVLKSFKLLKEGILIPTNETNCYIYLVDKPGNMLPYCFPESKLRAPFGLTVKYVLCKEGILLPVLVEVVENCIQFSFEDTVVYKKRVYTIEQVLEIEREKKHNTETIPEKPEANSEKDICYFTDKKGNCVYYERVGNYLKRHPSQKVEAYLLHTTGYFKILSDGFLKQTDYPDPTCENLHVMIEENGDLLIMPNSVKKLEYCHYLLACCGDLIPVEVKKREYYIKFYRNGERVFKQMLENWKCEEPKPKTPLGEDPMGVMKDPEPNKSNEKEPHYIPIPIECSKKSDKSNCTSKDHDKCEHIRKIIQNLISKEPPATNLELEMNEKMMDEICGLVHKCSRLKSQYRNKRSVRKYSTDDDC